MTITTSGRFGLRSVAMLLCAYIWAGIGTGAAFEAVTTRPGVFHLLIPPTWRATAWIIAAAIAAMTCASRRWSALGLFALWIPSALTFGSYALSWCLFKVPGGNPGYPLGWYSAYLYLGLIGLVFLAALIPARRRVLIVSGETEPEEDR